ncbi:hypothetical protein [Mannheimia pernigra]|uniref:hypothetical protein n=1 Tax=Mannheimia pernigra TaxID=111844 RepID=UPI001F16AA85|nr:hypothetical protein [Mannheimia pernigra]
MNSIKEFFSTKNSPINVLMQTEWFLGFILLVTYLDAYFQLVYQVPIYIAIKQREIYFTNAIDYIAAIFFFSITFTALFTIIRFLHIFILSGLLNKIGCKTYEIPKLEDIHKYELLSTLKRRAARENNTELRKYCESEEERIRTRISISRRFLGIVLFTIIHIYFAEGWGNYPLVIEFIFEYLGTQPENFKFFVYIALSLLAVSIFYLFEQSIKIESNYIYFPKDNT